MGKKGIIFGFGRREKALIGIKFALENWIALVKKSD